MIYEKNEYILIDHNGGVFYEFCLAAMDRYRLWRDSGVAGSQKQRQQLYFWDYWYSYRDLGAVSF